MTRGSLGHGPPHNGGVCVRNWSDPFEPMKIVEKMESAGAAGAILHRIFGKVPFGFAVRLWDGSRVHLGPNGEPFTLVFRRRETFRALVLRPNTLRFAVAYTEGDLDVEGDFFVAMRLANQIEAIHLGLSDRLAILRELGKV
jgi:hypothetical protein